jgi:hypothetical protein
MCHGSARLTLGSCGVCLLCVNVSTATTHMLVVLLVTDYGECGVLFRCHRPILGVPNQTDSRNQTHPYTPYFISTHLPITSKLIT